MQGARAFAGLDSVQTSSSTSGESMQLERSADYTAQCLDEKLWFCL
jgi:type II secretory pathway component PulJ